MDFESLILEIKGQTVTYSKAGGGASSILLIIFANKNSIWIWRYWEIWKGGFPFATENDDTTAITGLVAKATHALEGLTVEDIYLEDVNLMLTFNHGYVLKVFCEYDDKCDLEHWKYRVPSKDKTYTITSRLEIKEGTYY